MKVNLIDGALTGRLPEGVTLQIISAHYLGDRPDGLNIKFARSDAGDLQDLLAKLRKETDELWRTAAYHSATAAFIDLLLGELDRIRVKPIGSRSQKETLFAISLIDLLQRIGHLKPDEFNGICLMAADGKLPVTQLINLDKLS